MSPEVLMKPRYKVIAEYPGSECFIGQIIYQSGNRWRDYSGFLVSCDVTLYPHLFKKLEWWEERKPEEMPEYVKRCNNVFRFKLLELHDDYPRKTIGFFHVDGIYSELTTNGTLPATEQEYNEYEKSKTT